MVMRVLLLQTAVLCFGAASGCAQTTDLHIIARDGAAVMDIVVAESAPAPERHAAEELSVFLAKVTGGEFPVRHGLQADRPALLVGLEAARLAEGDFSIDGLAPDAIVMKSSGPHLILAGDRPRGALYAVYTFLQDDAGCRWWTSDAAHIPQRPTLTAQRRDFTYASPFEYRESFWFDAFDGPWSARNRCNGMTHRLTPEQGGRYIKEGFVHTFYRIIPPAQYFGPHPEWFSLIDGQRVIEHNGRPAQLCLTNSEMRAEFIANLRRNLRANPDAQSASVSQNDAYNQCQCANCTAIEEMEGSPAGLMLRFVNAVAAEIETEFPDVAISTLAYQYTRRPPTITRPRDDVIIWLCSIECSFSAPLTHDRNADFRDDIIGWSQISDRLYIWDYVTNFRHYLLPHPNVRVLGDNVRFFRDHNAVGMFEQGNYQSHGGEMAKLKAWVLAQLLWNPDLDEEALVREFAHGYYGCAGADMLAYLDVTHDAVAATGDHLGCFTNLDAEFLSFEVMARGWRALQRAEAAVADQPQYRARVQVDQLPVMYAFMHKWAEFRAAAAQLGAPWPLSEDIEQVHADFLRITEARRITHLSEWQPGFENLAAAVQTAASAHD